MKRREFIRNIAVISTVSHIPKSYAAIQDMPAISITGEEIILNRSDILELIFSFEGSILTEENYGYDQARMIWNGVWDKHPALIAFCESISDIQKAINFSRDQNLLVAVRGGGHSISGKSTCDGGIIIDLSRMRKSSIDLQRKTATVQPGCTLFDLDSKTLPYGYVVPAGVVSHTGIAGLTLGGGIGSLMRMYGLTIDSLRSVEIITADGVIRKASANENPDLFWGVRGGGGNFGIVTSFEYDLKPLKNGEVIVGVNLFDLKYAKEIWDFYYDYSEDCLLYTSPSPRDRQKSRMPSSA